jgi:hypothetical protein
MNKLKILNLQIRDHFGGQVTERYLVYVEAALFCFGFGMKSMIFYFVIPFPGFGEESCWFNSCSNALSIFLYG